MADVVRDLKTDLWPKEVAIHEGDRGATNHCFLRRWGAKGGTSLGIGKQPTCAIQDHAVA